MWIKGEQQAFLSLVRAGLWADTETTDLRNHGFSKDVDWEKVYQMAGEQSVVGVVLAGIERLKGYDSRFAVSQDVLLQMIGEVQMMEQTNKAMNQFIEKLVGKMREADIYTLLVKGQGIAQCYERPLWRTSGDVDLLLSKDNYQKAKQFLLPLSSGHKKDERYSKHLGMSIDQWYVEIHGSLRTGLSERIDQEVDAVQKDVFYDGNVRSWDCDGTTIFLPAPDNDVFFVFTHFIKHFYKEGMNLRQVCDWCRLLWTFKDSLNHGILEKRIRRAGLMSEWKAFAALAVEYLGMPIDAVPLLDGRSLMEDGRWRKKGERILKHILKGEPYNKVRDTWAIAKIFPLNTCKFLPAIFLNVNGLKIKERFFVPQKSQKGRK